MWCLKTIVAAGVGTLVALTGPAAADGGCGTKLLPEHLPRLQARIDAGAYELEGAVAASYTIPLTIHVVRRTDGSLGIPQSQIDQAIADASVLWNAHQIEFCQIGFTKYIDDDAYYFYVNTMAEIDALRSIDPVPNTINVYCTYNLSADGEGFCGISSFTFSDVQGIVMANDCMGVSWNPSTLGHELGHYLDLFHTHETAYDEECTDGDNCAEAGDLVCDTPADPGLGEDGMVSLGCAYTGSGDGPCFNDPPYNPDPTNIMSYSRKTCRTNITTGQENRAVSALLLLRPNLLTYGNCSFAGICGAGAGNCYEDNGTPGCENPICCQEVCARDPYCCDNQWDGLCAQEALEYCAGCGTDAAGNCYTNNGTPGCRNDDCCELVCDSRPYCCSFEWDQQCADDAFALCADCGGAGTGPCDVVHATPGCDDAACCEAVCAIEPSCCELQWDPVCVGLAINLGCGSPGAGDECANCYSVDEGSYFITLSDNTGASGDDSSCATGDIVDQWYCYTPTCTGTAEASICTEFTDVDITLSVFDGCGGTELACSDTHSACGFPGGAQMSWFVVSGNTYYVRASAVGATPTNNFQGTLVISCGEGCGTAGTGNCFEDNGAGSPYCANANCCAAVCAEDPFCCNMWWDNQCAEEAFELCTSCGDDDAGDCLTPNDTAGCDNAWCCEQVCVIDPYCCHVEWDSVCANEADTECVMTAFAEAHLPLGEATTTLGPGGTIIVSGVGPSGDDGVESDFEDGLGIDVGLQLPVIGGLPVGAYMRLEALGGEAGGSDETLGVVNAIVLGGAWHVTVAYPSMGTQTRQLRVYRDDEIVHAVLSHDGPAAFIVAAPDGMETRLVGEKNVSMSCSWNAWQVINLYGGPSVVGDRVALISDIGAAPDDPVGPPVSRVMTRVRLIGRNLGTFTVTGEEVTGCLGDTNADRDVDVNDLVEVITRWSTANPGADINFDGEVDVNDLVEVILNWGPC